jgi:nucleotide-binding universal stress UspA family protein
MSMQTTPNTESVPTAIFTRVLVGVDGSPEGLEAARQAAALKSVEGELTVVSVWNLAPPVIVPMGGGADRIDTELPRARAADWVRKAVEHIGPVGAPSGKILRGPSWQALLDEGRELQATLIAVGSHGAGRAFGIFSGSTATEIVHKAPCSVLVARPSDERFPRRVVVGVDGSPESAAAYAAGQDIAARFGSELWPVVAHGGKGVDKDAVATVFDHHHEDLPDEPVRALVVASADADLVIVGSRGLHGFKALGSVSERVAHEARCSTLIVRGAPSSGDDQP